MPSCPCEDDAFLILRCIVVPFVKCIYVKYIKITVSCNEFNSIAVWLTSKSLNMKLTARHVRLLGKAVSWLSMMLCLVRYRFFWLEIWRNILHCFILISDFSCSIIFIIYSWPKHDM